MISAERHHRPITIRFRASLAERGMIEQKMAQIGTTNTSAYLRKMAIDGYVVKLNVPELKELISLLRRCSNNLNQVTKRSNETGRIYSDDLKDLNRQLDGLWEMARRIMVELAKVN